MSLALIVLLPFIGAIFPPLMVQSGRNACAAATCAVSIASLAGLLFHAPAVFAGEVLTWRQAWIPGIGLDANFLLDPLGFFFALLILGIGILIIVYARFYLRAADPMGRFYTYLLLFQGAMLGIVLSDNILLLVIFWELTSLSSFLLIGYWRHLPEGRQGARMSLAVTACGGLALLAGMLLLGGIAGSYDLSTILTRGDIVRASPLYLPALILILLGAFTKSAQFPFHFWLPHAMAAPTPVSAYLHSATMVKAGLFLMARLWPAMAGTDAWFLIISLTGLVTMLIGAWIAIFKDDLKALLAFSTVSHLGLVTMLLGFATPIAAAAAVFHILNHATFKAGLFMTAGIVDHEAGTRDARRLGGLVHLMPVTATIAFLGSAAMAGIPLFNGFLSKEMMLEEAAHTTYAGNAWLFPVLATLAAVFSVAYAARYAISVFLGPTRRDYPHSPHDPSLGMWLPPALLMLPVVVIGIWPASVEAFLLAVTGAVTGGQAGGLHLKTLWAWHGVTPAMVMSAIAILAGLGLFVAYAPAKALRLAFPRPEAKRLFEGLVAAVTGTATRITDGLLNGSLQRYMAIVLAAFLVLGFTAFAGSTLGPPTRPMLPVSHMAIVAWILLVSASLAVLVIHHNRLLALIITSVAGLMVSLAFLHFSAPDLALTQISVEVVTVILLLLALNYLPKATPPERSWFRRLRDGVLAAAAGLGAAGMLYAVLRRDVATIADYFIAESKPGGGGANIVNVILVDFRGYDTFGEIIVLGIAALGIFALLDTVTKGAAGRRLARWEPQPQAAEAHPLILVVATRALLPLALVVGIYIFLRGHNAPGGGFIAGLIVGIALILQYMASSFAWANERLPLDYHAFIGAGVLTAGLTGIGAWFNGVPFLTSDFGYLHLPLIGEVELATAALFDLGVFLTVTGVVMLTLAYLSRVGRLAEPPDLTPGGIDIPLVQEPDRELVLERDTSFRRSR